MKLIVGLGNPGKKYQDTRHNIGWQVLAELAQRHASGKARAKFEGEVMEAQFGTEKGYLLCPMTYMNASGRSVRPASDFYKLSPQDILIICDDISLSVGNMRFRPQGSSGGQNGLKDIIQKLGTEEIPRLRIGVGQPPPQWSTADYVLSKFTKSESTEIQQTVAQATTAVADWVQRGIDFCMNQHNRKQNTNSQET